MGNEAAKEPEKKKTSFGDLVNTIIAMITSQLVFGGLMAFLGLRVALNPTSAPTKISWGIGLAILIATVGLFIGFFSTKSFNLSNIVPIIETIAFTVLGVCMIIFSKSFGVILEDIVSIAIIVTGVTNLICLKNYNDIQAKINTRLENRRVKREENEVLSGVGDAIKNDFDKYNGEFVNAAQHIKKKADATTVGQIILNVIIIIMALVMLFTRFVGAGSIYLVSGIIMILSGLNEMVLGFRSYKAKKQVDALEAEEEAETEAAVETEAEA